MASQGDGKIDGFIRQVQKDRYSLRLKISGGYLEADKLLAVYEIAKKYGNGYVHMTSRQSIEIPFIKREDTQTVRNELLKAGLSPAASGASVRTITACQGKTVCAGGLIDTTRLAKEFERRYYGRPLAHKFKIGITGCRNNCLKAEENDLGVKGALKPSWVEENCTYCGACEKVCREKCIAVNRESKTLKYEEVDCILCGRCIKVCPKKAWDGKEGFVVYFGGLFGNRITIGKQLLPVIFDEEVIHRIIEFTLDFFAKHGKSKERFATTLDRIGWDVFENEIKKIYN